MKIAHLQVKNLVLFFFSKYSQNTQNKRIPALYTKKHIFFANLS